MQRPNYNKFFLLFILIFTLVFSIVACVKFDLAPPPPIYLTATTVSLPIAPATPTVITWPTFSPRSTPVVMPVANSTPRPLCPYPNLPTNQHLSSDGDFTVTESTHVGRMLCHIKPGSCAYDLMVGQFDPTIIYKQEETPPFNTEDLMMHPGMVQPLARLNTLVLAEWNGAVQLRITDAYDSLLSHDPPQSKPKTRYSLHYEGRALDLTTWPVDRNLYGRLCTLALCAGFNWVHNEETHCHASIRAPSLCTQCDE